MKYRFKQVEISSKRILLVIKKDNCNDKACRSIINNTTESVNYPNIGNS